MEFLGSTPPAVIEGDKNLNIRVHAADRAGCARGQSPAISRADTADLVVTLTDDQGRPVASDAARPVTFAIQSGRGSITRKEIDIPAGQFQVRSTFQPAWLGQTSIFGRDAEPADRHGARPGVGAHQPPHVLAGGRAGRRYPSYLKRKRSGPRRIGIGIVTGFSSYWACLFVGLAVLGCGSVVNPLSAFALSTLGGWIRP